MRALVICPVFPPEPIVSAQTTAQIAEGLSERGHDVMVLTAFPNRPSGQLYPGYRRALYRRERASAGYQVLRCFSTLSAESRMFSRFAENISFGLTSGAAALTVRRPDVIYANSWPIFATGILALVTHWRRVPLVISVQDIYPNSLIAQGRVKAESWLTRTLAALDRRIAHICRDVIVISERFAEIYRAQRGLPAERVHVIPNWVDDRTVARDTDGVEIRVEMDIPADAFLLVYGGNVGVAAGLEGVIQAFGGWPSTAPPPYLLVAGAGASLETCRTLAARIADDRVRFLTPWPVEKTEAVYAAADVLVLPTYERQSLVSVPSKLIAYMLAGRPIIAQAIAGSDLAHLIEDAHCGWVISPGDPGHLATTVQAVMALSEDERARRGQAGRAYATEHLTRSACLPRVLDLLEQAGSTRA